MYDYTGTHPYRIDVDSKQIIYMKRVYDYHEILSFQRKLYSSQLVDVSSLDLFDVSLREMFLPNRTVDDNTIEVLETDIPVTPTKRCRKKDRKKSIFEYY